MPNLSSNLHILTIYLACIIALFSIFCLLERNILRLIAISSISNICYIILAVLIDGLLSRPFVIMIVGDIAVKFLLFSSIAIMIKHFKTKHTLNYMDEDQFKILLSSSGSFVKFAFIACFFVIVSLPPSPIFFAKFDILLSTLNRNQYFIFVMLIIANVLNVMYFLRVLISAMFTNQAQINNEPIPIAFAIVFAILMGFYIGFSLIFFRYGFG